MKEIRQLHAKRQRVAWRLGFLRNTRHAERRNLLPKLRAGSEGTRRGPKAQQAPF